MMNVSDIWQVKDPAQDKLSDLMEKLSSLPLMVRFVNLPGCMQSRASHRTEL